MHITAETALAIIQEGRGHTARLLHLQGLIAGEVAKIARDRERHEAWCADWPDTLPASYRAHDDGLLAVWTEYAARVVERVLCGEWSMQEACRIVNAAVIAAGEVIPEEACFGAKPAPERTYYNGCLEALSTIRQYFEGGFDAPLPETLAAAHAALASGEVR